MHDLISRQALCEYALNQKDKSITPNDIMRFPSAPQWISVSDRLPDNYTFFYATCKSRIDQRENWVIEGCYTNTFSWGEVPMIVSGDAEVIAWMPKELPEPYRDENN